MSIGAFNPSLPAPRAYSAPSTMAVMDTGTSSGPVGADVPVVDPLKNLSLAGTAAGAIGGGFVGWKVVAPLLAKMFASSKTLPGLAVAGIIGGCVLVGAWVGKVVSGGGIN